MILVRFKKWLRSGWFWFVVILCAVILFSWLAPNHSRRLLRSYLGDKKEQVQDLQNENIELRKKLKNQDLEITFLNRQFDSLHALELDRLAREKILKKQIQQTNEEINIYRSGTFDERGRAFAKLFDTTRAGN